MIQLNPPSSVVVHVEGTKLILAGEAPHSWIQQAQLLGPLVPGVTHIEMAQLVETGVKQFETLKANLEKKTIAFGVGESSISQDQRSVLMDIAQTIQALDHTASVLGISPRIHIQGFASPDGKNEANKRLSVLRAKAVLNELADGSFRAISLGTVGMGPALASGDKTLSQGRFVTFQVVLAPSRLSQSRK
jgi:outer membrane protein OmpA-like peptidoglycan-associated protein